MDTSDALSSQFSVRRVNDITTLRFLGHRNNSINDFSPEFMHQIFDEEKLSMSLSLKIILTVDLVDLSSDISVENYCGQIEYDNIMSKMAPFVTPKFELSAECKVIGKEIAKITINSEEYLICLANHSHDGCNELVKRFERLAVFFIETADSVDFTDERWEILILYHIKDNNMYYAGYTTLFRFHNPIHGSKMRICQALVLPPYQRRGLGRLMLTRVYELARTDANIVEVTVEDPCEGFRSLRDIVDVQWAMGLAASSLFGLDPLAQGLDPPQRVDQGANITSARLHKSAKEFSNCDIEYLHNILKITAQQICFVLAALEYRSLVTVPLPVLMGPGGGIDLSSIAQVEKDAACAPTSSYQECTFATASGADQDQGLDACRGVKRPFGSTGGGAEGGGLKDFRLWMKKRLLRENGELRGCERGHMQRELESLYQEMLGRFQRVMACSALWHEGA